MPWVAPVVAVIGAVVGVAGSLIGASQQASAMKAQAAAQEAAARQQQQIAMFNAQIQRQNTQVAYQMAVAQAESNQQLAMFNAAVASSNSNLAQLQAVGARNQYNQGVLNAEQKAKEADAERRQGEEAQRRQREENALRISSLRSKYGASGVTFEGTPLEVLSDAARIGEVTVQDLAYSSELQSRKSLRESELEKWKAGFSLIDEYGFKVQAENYKNEVIRHEYESDLAGYDQAIAGAQYKIGQNKAKLIELGGEAQYQAGLFEAAQTRYKAQGSLISGAFGAVSSGLSGLGSAVSSYGQARGGWAGFPGKAPGQA